MGLKQIAVTLVMVSIFAFSIIAFGTNLATDNSATRSIADNTPISNLADTLNESFLDYPSDVNSSQNTFSQTEPTIGGESLQITSVASIWKTIVSLPVIMYKATVGLVLDVIFGGTTSQFSMIFSLIITMMVVIIILFAWKWIRGGDPE